MKRSLFYLLILAAVLVCPTKATDVGRLRPVQTVAVFESDGSYAVVTDTKDSGSAEDLSGAIRNLKATTPATIYLDTAQYLIVSDEALVEELRPYLKKNVKLYRFVGTPPMEAVSKFLAAHGDGPSLGDWKPGDHLPVLDCQNERLIFR